MNKALSLIIILAVIFLLSISITTIQKTLKIGNHEELSAKFEYKEAKKFRNQIDNKYLCFINIPLCVIKHCPNMTVDLTNLVNSLVDPELVTLLIQISVDMVKISSIFIWIMIIILFFENVIWFTINIVYYRAVLIFISFFVYLLLKQHCEGSSLKEMNEI